MHSGKGKTIEKVNKSVFAGHLGKGKYWIGKHSGLLRSLTYSV